MSSFSFYESAGRLKTSLESSKWFIGAAAILVPLLSKTERLKLSTLQKQVLENEYVDLVFVFTIVFTATRDLFISLAMTFLLSSLVPY